MPPQEALRPPGDQLILLEATPIGLRLSYASLPAGGGPLVAHGSVIHGQSTLGTGISPGNWG